MAVKNFPDISPDANPSFTLENNTSSFESALNKNVQHMELPGARWRGSVAFSNRSRQEANKIKAFMTSLGGQVGRFYLTPFDAYQSGTMSGAGVVDGVVASGVSSIPTKGWEADQDTLFEAGDYIEVNGELKMVTNDVSAPQSYIEYTGTNYMPSPFDPSGWTAGFGTISTITGVNPSGASNYGLFEITTNTGFAKFSLSTSRFNALAGETIYACALLKQASSGPVSTYWRANTLAGGYLSGDVRNITDGDGDNYTYTNLSHGWVLVCYSFTLATDEDDIGCEFIIRDADGITGTIGTDVYVQAAYFGKADDWPANYLATADIPIAPPLRKSLVGGESITVVNPKGKFYLGSNDQSWDINVNGVQSMGFDFIEDVN